MLWPPSLTSDGGLLPLFEGSRCVFTADLSSSPDSSLYVHTNTDTSEHNRTIPLHKVDGTGSGFAILRNAAKLSFVTTRNWVFSSAVLLHPSDLVAEDWLHEPNLNPQLNLDKGRCVLELPYPCEVMSYQKRGGIQIFEIVKDQRSYSFDVDLTNKVKVRRRLGASLDYLTVFEKAFPSEHPANKGSLREADEERSLAPGMPKDIVFAKARRNGETRRQCGADRYRALRRKAGR